MALPFPQASIKLDYPLYAVSFDPQNANRLVVGGGGGVGRSGVGNKISVVEIVDQGELRVAGDIDLSRDEDSVMSLAVVGAPDDDKPSYVFAGINSGPKEIAKGKNFHLRTFSVEQTKSRAAGAKNPDVQVAEVARSSFFTDRDAETYQRVLRISGSVGAAATGMGKEPQLAIFDVTGPKPKAKGVLDLAKDAEDLDLIYDEKTGEHLLVYCHKYELYLVRIGKKNSEPELIFTMTDDHGELPAFRALRFITPNFILAAANLPKSSGVILQGFRLPSPGHDKARISAVARIPKKISATALAVANVSPPSSPSTSVGTTQFIIAVAGNDASIYLYTMDHKAMASIELLSNLYPLCTLKDVHKGDNITGLAFSNFVPPKQHLTQQFIKLASISLQKGVTVHSIALKRHIDASSSKTPGEAPVRYVTAMRAKAPSRRPLVITLSIMVLIMAIIGQGVMEIYGVSKPYLGAQKFVPSWHGTLRDPTHPPAAFSKDYLVSRLAGSGVNTAETLVMWEADHPAVDVEGSRPGHKKISLDVHDEEVHGPAKTWEELPTAQKNAWKQRLQKAGAWTQNMGESVFKGILFGELAGAVGHAVAEGLA
ncbi:guanine nucleotide exchange factor-like protein [Trichoderma citrinoviride]|uniref:Guanine nucleotide-exchange factor SEC12 n=1 Tax=Trichoderma citrinoviride TaxID=58853 RepID=A0A2T4BAI3_9HYPO|nr:guanine nucleotide exchange factor-like protein [Trichoderma citrinoviride]PTB66342.1 guanine nucleotide exchange factor-like protein [Trichoderma citrinoviride]